MNGLADKRFHLFVADGATHVGEPTDANEAERIEWMPRRRAAPAGAGGRGAGRALAHRRAVRPASLDVLEAERGLFLRQTSPPTSNAGGRRAWNAATPSAKSGSPTMRSMVSTANFTDGPTSPAMSSQSWRFITRSDDGEISAAMRRA